MSLLLCVVVRITVGISGPKSEAVKELSEAKMVGSFLGDGNFFAIHMFALSVSFHMFNKRAPGKNPLNSDVFETPDLAKVHRDS